MQQQQQQQQQKSEKSLKPNNRYGLAEDSLKLSVVFVSYVNQFEPLSSNSYLAFAFASLTVYAAAVAEAVKAAAVKAAAAGVG